MNEGRVQARTVQASGTSNRPKRRWALYALVALGALALSAFSLTRFLDPFDEGLALQAARRVASGEVPYQDFQWAYGPAQPYLLGALWELIGPSLLVWRLIRVAVNVGVALVAFALIRRAAPTWLALAGSLTVACAMAQPLSPNPFAPGLLLALAAVAVATSGLPVKRAALLAGVFCGLAAAWRLDFGLYSGGALLVLFLTRADGERLRSAALFSAAAMGTGALAYAPFLIAHGPAGMWDSLVGNSLRDHDYWTLPFPFEYEGKWTDVEELLAFYVPLASAIGLGVAGVTAAVRWLRDRTPPSGWLGILVFALGGWLYLRSRTDEFHETPLVVALAILLPLCAAWAIRARLWILAAPALAVLCLLLGSGLSNRAAAFLAPPELEPLRLDIADGVDTEPDDAAALPEVVRLIRERVPEGGEMYVITRRSDLVRIGNPMLYVLADRDNALREDFDLLTEPDAQRSAVERLEADPPPVIVRWTDPKSSLREPNRRGEASDSRELDEYVEAAYRLLERNGYYDVLVPGSGSSP